MMLSSANEACNIAAEYIAGSVDAFVQMMNDKAAELGCTQTLFQTPTACTMIITIPQPGI